MNYPKGGSSKTRPTLRNLQIGGWRLEEENDLFVEIFPDAVEQRVTHGSIAAVDFHLCLGVGEKHVPGDAIAFGNVVAVDSNPGLDHRLGLILVVQVRHGFAGNLVSAQLAQEAARR